MTDDVLKLLECPICLNGYTERIFVCIEGHSVCERCKDKLADCEDKEDGKKCPECRKAVNGRNRALEQLCSFYGKVSFSDKMNDAILLICRFPVYMLNMDVKS